MSRIEGKEGLRIDFLALPRIPIFLWLLIALAGLIPWRAESADAEPPEVGERGSIVEDKDAPRFNLVGKPLVIREGRLVEFHKH